VKSYFYVFSDSTSLLIILQKDSLESLLIEAKQLEKKYEWLQATDYYEKAVDLALKKKQPSLAAELLEKIGFCYYKAALQAPTNIVFKKHMKKSILTYRKEQKYLLEDRTESNELRLKHVNALIEYTRSWLEGFKEKKKSATKWWILENEVLTSYESMGKLDLAGKTCNDLIDYNLLCRYWLTSGYTETVKITNECIELAEKAIKIYSKLNDNHELARAYAYASWYYGRTEKFPEVTRQYAKKALKLAQKTSDAEIISWSYLTAFVAAESSTILCVKKAVKYARISKDKRLMALTNSLLCTHLMGQAKAFEDPEKAKKTFAKTVEIAQQGIYYNKIVNFANPFNDSYCSVALASLSELEIDRKVKLELLEKAIKVINEGNERYTKIFGRKGSLVGLLLNSLAENLFQLSKFKKGEKEQKDLLVEARLHFRKSISFTLAFDNEFHHSISYRGLAWIEIELARIERNKTQKIKHLKAAISDFEAAINLVAELKDFVMSPLGSSFFGEYYNELGGVFQQEYSITEEEKSLVKALKSYQKASTIFERANLSTHLAQSHWHIAQLYDLLYDPLEASKNYELASEAYNLAAKKIPQLSDFYKDYSSYMQAWSQIEKARHSHSIEDYEDSQQHYKKAAELHESTGQWNYLAANYSAWAIIEEAEGLSRNENMQQAKVTFQKALDQFVKAENSIKEKIGEITSAEEKEMTQKLLQASNLRSKYCQARVLMEDAKLLDREGNYLQSSRRYGEAAKSISAIVEKMDVEAERKELEYLGTLCRAWEKMAVAEERSSSESYLEAAEFFEEAKDYCFTRKASLWALGNSSFCKGLAAGIKYQSSADLTEHSKAKSLLKNAANSYLQAGFNQASEYSKATQRLFDAYAFMNQAEKELNQEKRAKHYQMAENLLQIAAGSFMKAKQPEKTAKVKLMLENVKEEKAMAASLNEVMRAPIIASTTSSFTAPSPTSETSVGLESFQHANVQANLIVGLKEVRIGESFCLSVEFVNAGKEPALLTRVEDFVPPDFIVVKKPEIYRLEDSCLNMKGKQIAPLKLVEAKLVLQPSKKGIYQLKPTVHYLDELGQNKSLQLKSVEIKVEEIILADRISTGTKELDSLLMGGIPKEYAVVLTGSPSDERDYLIKNFLEAGVQEEQTSFYVTAETVGFESLFETSGFYLFLCNPNPKKAVPDLPNITWLKSKTDLNNLNMALVRASRSVQQEQDIKRIVIGNVSDVLLKDGPEVTRRWLSELVTDLGSKGFTILAVLDSSMHPVDQANAIINLFDGEINLTQTGVPPDCKKSLLIKKLRGQDYIKNPICLKI